MKPVTDLSIHISEDYSFSAEGIESELSTNKWVRDEWPVVYIIKSKKKKQVYIGESTSVRLRLGTHLSDPKKSELEQVSIIGSDWFNKSATLDLESHLIQYFFAEQSFELKNGNNGLTRHNYYDRDIYRNQFPEVWNKLRDRKVVFRSLEEIRNTNLFRYSPYKSLSQDQFNSVIHILERMTRGAPEPIFVSGSAGTGKTILATYLIKLLSSNVDELNTENLEEENYRELELVRQFRKHHDNRKPTIGFVIAMTPLRTTMKKVFQQIPGLDQSMVISPSDTFKKSYDILIVDEAHRLRQRKNISWMGNFTKRNKSLGLGNEGTELDWIMSNSAHQVFFYDAGQSVKPSDISATRFEKLLTQSTEKPLVLKSQMRIKTESDYISFVDQLLLCERGINTPKFVPHDYDLRLFESFNEMYAELKVKEDQFGLCRLVAGYSWFWETAQKNPKRDYDIEIEGSRFAWNRTDKDWINSATSFQEIGCIHTVQGYDLNYVAVIFGREIIYNPELDRIEIIKENYFDKKGKEGLDGDHRQLKNFILNIYKTIMYRGIRGTFLYVHDENLRKYFAKHVLSVPRRPELRVIQNTDKEPTRNFVPLYDISAAAGTFSELQQASIKEWIELPARLKSSEDYFACQVTGNSMNKKIQSGDICLFRKNSVGTRNGEIVLVELYDTQDKDSGGRYTVKRYHSIKRSSTDSWLHESIRLSPDSTNSSYNDLVFTESTKESMKVVGVFVQVLNTNPHN